VKSAATELGLRVSHSVDDVVDLATSGDVELGVVVAFGQLVKPHVLDVLPFVNLHFSLLPRWRGAAPVERALLAGDDVTGVCVMRLEEGLDTGGIYATRTVPIGETTVASELRENLVDVGVELLVDTLSQPLETWIGECRPQQGEPTYAAKFSAADFEIDWAVPVVDIHRLIRVGGAWTTFRSKRLKINSADLVDGRIVPTVVQPEGKTPMPFDAWRNGARPSSTELFGDL
jgi:methionyl-tRNA formyltransferase